MTPTRALEAPNILTAGVQAGIRPFIGVFLLAGAATLVSLAPPPPRTLSPLERAHPTCLLHGSCSMARERLTVPWFRPCLPTSATFAPSSP